MERIGHELNILARAVAYKNLSGASAHVGVSQPQLSRMIKKMEEELGIVLLDRSAKRNASWTPMAYKLSDLYTKRMRALDHELEALVGETQTRQILVGTLEGLSSIALQFVHSLFEGAGVRLIEIDVFDLDRLEEFFTRGDLDLIFTVREPGRKKFRYARELGFQSLEQQTSNAHFDVMSTFEYGVRREKLKGSEKVLISNSLGIRREWFSRFGGRGTLPSELKKQKSSRQETERAVLLGADTLSPSIWDKLSKIEFKP